MNILQLFTLVIEQLVYKQIISAFNTQQFEKQFEMAPLAYCRIVPERHLQILSTPYLHTRVIGAKLIEILPGSVIVLKTWPIHIYNVAVKAKIYYNFSHCIFLFLC